MIDNSALNPADIAALKKEILSSLHCALPGVVVSFDASSGTAVIRPAVKHGDKSMPLLFDVPVYLPEAREILPGSFCLVIFADCDIDAWFASGDVAEPPSGRRHSLSDAFAFVGFRPAGVSS